MTSGRDSVPLVRTDLSPIHGQGVFAVTRIAAGTLIGRYEGFDTDENGTHVLWIERDDGWRLVEGTGVLRWLNHSGTPNAEFDGADLYALVEIEPGIEITFDYGPDWAAEA